MPYDSPERVGSDVAAMLGPGLEGPQVNSGASRVIGGLVERGQVFPDRSDEADWFKRFYRRVNNAYGKRLAAPGAEFSYESPAARERREARRLQPPYEHGLIGPRRRVRLD